VTDAHVVLNHFPGTSLLAGEFKLDEQRARQALNQLALEMSGAAKRKVTLVKAAQGLLEVVTTNMERALRHISVERGHDPRDFTLIPFGGAGGLHAVELARALRVPRVLVPVAPGALSALGCLRADVVKSSSRTLMLEVGGDAKAQAASVERAFVRMEREARAALKREGFDEERQRHERSIAARYAGQSFELEVAWDGGGRVVERFHREHEARYGYAQSADSVEVVSARLRSAGLVEGLKDERPRRVKTSNLNVRPHRTARVHFDEGARDVAVYRREELPAGARLKSPCVVTEYSSTTLVPAGSQASVDGRGNLIVELRVT
jgi:N-methylhydantoinase A